MSIDGATKSWFTAADLADLALPGLPKVKRKVNELAAEQRWAFQVGRGGEALARPRAGRGGGLEYHFSLLPAAATAEMMRRGLLSGQTNIPEPKPDDATQLWAWFERQPDKVKAEARRRLAALDAVAAMERTGATRGAAIACVCAVQGVSPATLWNWIGFVSNVPDHDRLPRLAPRRQGGGAEASIDDTVWRMFKSDYLRPERPTLSSCYLRVADYARAHGIDIPHVKTFQRKLERETDGRVIIAKREGFEALRRVVPAQQRSVADLGALELVNIDGHKWDVFVRFPAKNGEPERIARPMMVAIADIFSRKFLAWRIGATESAVQTRLCFADLFRDYGIPDGCLLDNGRAFASKMITGGSQTRFRFKILPEDPTGLLTALGIQNHWATPYRGQSKPIERGFRDLCDHGAKHPAFAGAYTGNNPLAKPDNYRERAIDLDLFIRVVGQIMAAHNARTGRRTEAANGRSFDEAFADSYAARPIKRATAEQMRMALLAADLVSTDRKSGAISLYGNRFWCDALNAIAGQKVMVRFDPDNLASELHVYAMDGRFLVTAPVIEAVGFLDLEAAKTRARQEAALRKTTKAAIELEALMTAQQIAAELPDYEPEPTPAPRVVRPVRVANTVGGGAATATAAKRAPLIDHLDFEELVPAREERPALRLVE